MIFGIIMGFKHVNIFLYDCKIETIISAAYGLNVFAGVRIWGFIERKINLETSYDRCLFYSFAFNSIWLGGVM